MPRNIWHFKHKRTGLMYMEWKYFNFVTDDLCGFISYTFANPANRLGMRRLILNYRLFEKGRGRTVNISKHKMDLQDEECFTMGEHMIKFNSDDTVQMRGRHGQDIWDLKYTPMCKMMSGLRNYKVGTFGWEDLSWEGIQPRSKVEGWVQTGTKKNKINGTGYHDGNWGTWLGFDAIWHWLQVNHKDTSIILAEIYNRNKGNIYLEHKGNVTTFHHNQYSVEHIRWKGNIPVETNIEADDGTHRLGIRILTLDENTKYYKRPLMLGLGGYISVQKVKVKGTIKRRGAITRIDATGFREYTSRQI